MQANIDDETGQCDNTISVSEEESLKEFINKQGQNSGQIRYKDETLKREQYNIIKPISFSLNFIDDLHKIAKRSTSTVKDWLQIATLNVRSIFQPRPDPAQDRLINLFAQSRRRPRLINSLESRDNLLKGKTYFKTCTII